MDHAGQRGLVSGLLAALIVLVLSRVVCALAHPLIGIRQEGDRIFVQTLGSRIPATLLLPIHDPAIHNARFMLAQITAELLPESETRFFERLSGVPVTFSRAARGKMTHLTAHVFGGNCSFSKISDQPPKTPEPPKPRVAIRLDTELLDACVGYYEFPPDTAFPTGIKLKIWRRGDQLIGQAWNKNVVQGAFDIYPESETNFFLTIIGMQLTFIKNDKGEVTAVIGHEVGLPDCVGKKLKN